MSCFGFGMSKKSKKQAAYAPKLQQLAQQCAEGEQSENSDDEISVSSAICQEGPGKCFAKQQKKEDKLVAVVVTISEGSSYDENFRVMEPKTVPGERVSTYSLGCRDVGLLLDYLASAQQVPAASTWQELIEDIISVPADSMTFNWECCSGCSEHGFPNFGSCGRSRRGSLQSATPSPTMQLMGFAVHQGFTVMCSDFSLKALIADWSEELLGPNPFVKMDEECDKQFQLDFLPSELQHEEVPQQLQVVGELCAEQGKAIVAAMGGTIVYTVNPRRAETAVYDLKVLTVVSDWAGMRGDGGLLMPEAMKCSVGAGATEKRGAAGHVTLTYASGGQLLTSMGHWIELTRVDTALDSVMQVVARNFGQEEMARFHDEQNCLHTDSERREHVQKWSKELVQKSVPTRMKMRTKY